MTLAEFVKISGYADIADLPEDKRIDLIGRYVLNTKQTIGVLTDCGPGDEGKADRYIKKLRNKFPSLNIIGKEPGPVADCVCIRVGPPVN